MDALECEPTNIRFQFINARLQYLIHRYTKAYQILKPLLKLLKDNKTRANCLFFIAKCELKMGKELHCIDNFKKVLELDVNHYGASIHLGNILVSKGKGQSAAEYFANAVRIDPN